MKVSKIEALDKFAHGRLHMSAGDTDKIEAGEAEELRKAGLVKILKSDDEQHEGEKMAPISSNKMDKPVSNKQVK